LNALQGDAFRALIPTEFQGEAHWKNVNTFGDLVKSHSNAQKLIGKNIVPPAADAPPEEWGKLFERIVGPQDPKNYALDKVEGVPDEVVKEIVSEAKLGELMAGAKLHPVQAKAFATNLVKAIHTATEQEKVADEKAFGDLMTTLFGQNAEAVKQSGKAALASALPKEMLPHLEKLDNTGMAVVIAMADHMKRSQGEENFLPKSSGGNAGSGETEATIKAKMTEIYKNPAYGDPSKDRGKHAELTSQMKMLEEKLTKIYGQSR
jgi:hypothetical protein